jgi:oligosaccharide reducing-end xylanase
VAQATSDAGAPAAATVDYAAGARQLLTVMRHKVDQNGGIVDGVTDTFDPNTTLVFVQPDVTGADLTSPSIELPGFYDLWAQATGDPFWNRAATAARDYWARVAYRMTGLVPARSHFDGAAVGSQMDNNFAPDAYRSLVNFVVDRIWSTGGPLSTPSPATDWDVTEATNLMTFFIEADINQYGREFMLDGATVDSAHDNALVAANGTLGLISTATRRSDFIQAVWDMDIATGSTRYFIGTMQLMSLLLLGGQFQVY